MRKFDYAKLKNRTWDSEILGYYISATDTAGNTFVLFTPLPPYETPEAIDMICDSCSRVIGTQEAAPLILIPFVIRDFLPIKYLSPVLLCKYDMILAIPFRMR